MTVRTLSAYLAQVAALVDTTGSAGTSGDDLISLLTDLRDSALWYDQAMRTVDARTGTDENASGVLGNTLITMTNASANTLTIPTGLLSAGQAIVIAQTGAGQTTIVAAEGVTINVESGYTLALRGQWCPATLLCIATDTYIAGGALEAS